MTDQPHLPDDAAVSAATAPVAVSEPPAGDPSANGDGARGPSAAMILFDQVTKTYEPNIPGLIDVSLQNVQTGLQLADSLFKYDGPDAGQIMHGGSRN